MQVHVFIISVHPSELSGAVLLQPHPLLSCLYVLVTTNGYWVFFTRHNSLEIHPDCCCVSSLILAESTVFGHVDVPLLTIHPLNGIGAVSCASLLG